MRTGNILLLYAEVDAQAVLTALLGGAWPDAQISHGASAVAFAEALAQPYDLAIVQFQIGWDETHAIVAALARRQPNALIAVVAQTIAPMDVQQLTWHGAELCVDLSMRGLRLLADRVQRFSQQLQGTADPQSLAPAPPAPSDQEVKPAQPADPLQDVLRAALRSTGPLDRGSSSQRLHATARAARAHGQPEKEVQALETLLAIEPPDVIAGEQLIALYERDKPKDAVRVLQRLAESSTGPFALRERYKQLVALQLESLHDAEAALQTWTVWRRRDPDNIELTRILRDTLQRLRRWPEFATLLTELIAESQDLQQKQELSQELVQLQTGPLADALLPTKGERPSATVHPLRPRPIEPQAKIQRPNPPIELQLTEDTQEKLAVVVHDLQEPLRSVDSYLQVLQSRYGEQLSRDAVELVNKARGAAQRMRGRVEGLRAHDSDQTEAASSDASDEATDAKEVLKQTLQDLGAAISRNNATVRAAELPAVAVGKSELAQVFENLVTNALKYRSEEPPFIHIDASRDGENWRFRIADNGLGIARSDHARIFRLGERANKALPGTGLGLATCARIVERCGGRIWVESELGHGAAFFFTLPAVFQGEGGPALSQGEVSRSQTVF